MTGTHQKHLNRLATLFGEMPEQVITDIDEDWTRLGHMQPGHLPAAWRDGHLTYPIHVPTAAGCGIVAHAQATLDTVTLELGSQLNPRTGRHHVDRGVMFSPDREVTTRLAEWMREQILDDGSEPLGIRFDSRAANGSCWALWMPRADARLGRDPVEAAHGRRIASSDPVMKQVPEAYGTRNW